MTLLKRLDSRLPRLLLALVIAVALLSVVAERALYRTSIEAVVNAPRVDIVAPMDGIVDSVGVATGDAVAQGAVIARLRRDAWTASADAPAAVRSAFLRERVDIVARELETLIELADSMTVREARFRKTSVGRLVADLRAAEARVAERQLVMEQVEAMQKVDGSTKLDVARARAELTTAEAEVARIATTLNSARSGVTTGEGGQDVPYSRQRLDQLTIDIARLRAERDALKAEARTMTVGALSVQGDSTGKVSVTAPTAGITWTLSATAGERVLKGTPLATLVDCRRAFLEASVTPRDGDRIEAKQRVVVRFAGTSIESRGTVRSVRGGGLRPDGSTAAELVLVNRRGDTRVIVDLDTDAIGQSSANFCQVGRHAKVFFDEEAGWRPLQLLSALTR